MLVDPAERIVVGVGEATTRKPGLGPSCVPCDGGGGGGGANLNINMFSSELSPRGMLNEPEPEPEHPSIAVVVVVPDDASSS